MGQMFIKRTFSMLSPSIYVKESEYKHNKSLNATSVRLKNRNLCLNLKI